MLLARATASNGAQPWKNFTKIWFHLFRHCTYFIMLFYAIRQFLSQRLSNRFEPPRKFKYCCWFFPSFKSWNEIDIHILFFDLRRLQTGGKSLFLKWKSQRKIRRKISFSTFLLIFTSHCTNLKRVCQHVQSWRSQLSQP